MRASPDIRSRRGFTLVEVLVAATLVVVIVVMLTLVFNEISRAWQRGEGRSERRRSARSLSDFIATELQGAVLPVETKSQAGQKNLQFLINPPPTQVPADYRYADAAFWQAPIATEMSFGEVAEIGYFVKWLQTAAPPVRRPVLCRFFVNPSKDAAGAPAQNPDFLIYTNLNSWLSSSLLDSVAPADKASGYVGLFAENVVGLWFRCYGLNGVELPKPFDSRTGYEYTESNGTKTRRYLPAVVVVSIVQLDSRLAVRMDAVWETVRALSLDPSIPDAAEFITKAKTDPALQPLLDGLRTYTTQVQLLNGR